MFPPISYVETPQQIVTRIKRAYIWYEVAVAISMLPDTLVLEWSGESVLTDDVLVKYIAYEAKT
jgi:hypothetical protein